MLNKFLNALDIILRRGLMVFLSTLKHIFISNLLKILFNRKFYFRKIYNFQMFLNNDDKGISRSLILFGKREEDQKFILDKILKSHMKVFDVGSNIGYYVLIESRLLKSEGKILAIEPDEENIKLLKKNIQLNNPKVNIQILKSAVSNKSGIKKFYYSQQSNLHSFHPDGSAKKFLSGKSKDIEVTTISDLSKKYFKPDIIRMDVEGHEVEIMESLIKDVRRGFLEPIICFEPHISCYTKSHNFAPVLQNLFKIGYKTKFLSSNAISGTNKIQKLTQKDPIKVIKSDGEIRSIFENIKPNDCIKILTETGGARTVLLKK